MENMDRIEKICMLIYSMVLLSIITGLTIYGNTYNATNTTDLIQLVKNYSQGLSR
jgi:Ni,Fe-hydrogenase I cytochrome b subunit